MYFSLYKKMYNDNTYSSLYKRVDNDNNTMYNINIYLSSYFIKKTFTTNNV